MKQFSILIALFLLLSVIGLPVQAQTTSLIDNHTVREEAEGKEIWEKLQAKQTTCDKLSGDDFERLGEYFMGQMAGSSHEAMNNMMIQMMGKQREEQMHIAMGKRLSGCEPNAQIPPSGVGFMPMMWITMFAFWLLLILGVVALIRYLGNSGKSSDKDRSVLPAGRTPMDILKERYARGEISKKEFEEMKKELS